MPKKGMKRPERTHTKPHNELPPAPELHGKAKTTGAPANAIVPGTSGPGLKVFHTERPIPRDVYPAIDNDLARDNLENDIPAPDRP